MDERSKSIENLEFCLPLLKKLDSLKDKIYDKSNTLSRLKSLSVQQESALPRKILITVSALIGIFILYMLHGQIHMAVLFTALYYAAVFSLYSIIEKKQKEMHAAELLNLKRMTDGCEKEINGCFDEISRLLSSADGQKALSIIPQDYFCSAAVERFIFYLKTGRADTVLDAVREYDKFLYSRMREGDAKPNSEAERMIRNLEFRDLYSAYLNERHSDSPKR